MLKDAKLRNNNAILWMGFLEILTRSKVCNLSLHSYIAVAFGIFLIRNFHVWDCWMYSGIWNKKKHCWIFYSLISCSTCFNRDMQHVLVRVRHAESDWLLGEQQIWKQDPPALLLLLTDWLIWWGRRRRRRRRRRRLQLLLADWVSDRGPTDRPTHGVLNSRNIRIISIHHLSIHLSH